MNSNISQYSSFTVNGFLGTNSNSLDIPVILEFDTTDLFISSSSRKLRLQVSKKQLLYGIGTFVGQDDKNSRIVTQVHFTLDGFSQLINKESIGSTGNAVYTKYKVMSAFIGDFFVDQQTTFNDVFIYLTNFSNWLSGPKNNPDYFFPDPNKSQVTVKTPDASNILASSRLNRDLQLVRDDFAYNAQNNLTTVITQVGVTNYIKLKNIDASLSKLLLLNQQINSWYNLLTGTSETIYKVSGTKKFSPEQLSEVQLFSSNTVKTNLNDFSFITTVSPRNDKWYQNCIDSLSKWMIHYDDFISISNSVKPNQPGEIDQQLQNECVALQLMFDTFYKDEYDKEKPHSRRKKVNYVDMIEYILTNKINSDLVSEAVEKYDKNSDLDEFICQIKDIRNTLSHSSTLKEHVSLEKRILFRAILKVLIRDWLLSFIGIDRKYIDAEYTIHKPYDFSIIPAW